MMMATPGESWLSTNKAELKNLTLAALAVAFAFGWKFAGPATFGNWLSNFILVLLLVTVSILVHEIAHRFVAKRYEAKVSSKLFISAILAMLVLTILTNGWLVIAVPWAITITPLRFYRIGKPYPKWHLGPFETAKIAAAGPLANFALAVIAKMLIPHWGMVAEKLMNINIVLAVFNLLPFLSFFPVIFAKMTLYKFEKKEMPYVEGEFVFFGSRLLWMFIFSFVTIGGLCLAFMSNLTASLLIAFIISAILWVVWHFFEPEQEKDIGVLGGANVSWQEYYKHKIGSHFNFEPPESDAKKESKKPDDKKAKK